MKTKEPFNKNNCAYVHKVAAGDTLYKIARRYGVDYGRLMALNGITNPYQLKTGMEICIPPTLAPGGKNCAGFYIIGEGDTLYSISRRFGVSLDDLMAANSDIDPYNMHIGMKLCIPPKIQPVHPVRNLRTASRVSRIPDLRDLRAASGRVSKTLLTKFIRAKATLPAVRITSQIRRIPAPVPSSLLTAAPHSRREVPERRKRTSIPRFLPMKRILIPMSSSRLLQTPRTAEI